jgi:hypothetical protein
MTRVRDPVAFLAETEERADGRLDHALRGRAIAEGIKQPGDIHPSDVRSRTIAPVCPDDIDPMPGLRM